MSTDRNRDAKIQCNIYGETAKISAYEYIITKEILLSNQSQII